jgi:hypothetical protein
MRYEGTPVPQYGGTLPSRLFLLKNPGQNMELDDIEDLRVDVLAKTHQIRSLVQRNKLKRDRVMEIELLLAVTMQHLTIAKMNKGLRQKLLDLHWYI